MSREDTPVTEEVDPGPVITGKTVKGRAPGLALKMMEQLRDDLTEEGIETEHWRDVPGVVLAEVAKLRGQINELLEHPPVAVEFDTRIGELEEGLFEIGVECPPDESIIPYVIALIKTYDQGTESLKRTIDSL